ncbi:Unknown protein sequence [Pseudomonas syringae pv. castaneae]|uniref:Uncharacterized protein n=1 Tax=Pseudomonas syringae pv. castaneae TaxID=264450 RepID=A0A0N8R4I7_PSESX|nr:Unknown protein sequence [Pseudomonas syringae pv. castaneae]
MIILHRASENLRCRSGQAVDQQGHRAFVERAFGFVFQHIDLAVGITHQHGRALVDEQTGQLGRFLQRTATIVTQIQYHAIDLLGLQLGKQFLYVTGGALVFRIASTVGLEVQIERRDVDDPEFVVLAILFEVQDRLLGRLFFEFHRFTGDGDNLAGLVIRRIAGRDDLQTDHGTFRTADQLDDFIQTPADHIDHFLVALGNGHDLVGWRDLLGFGRRSCRDQTHDFHVVVIALQHSADAFQRQAHVDVEVFRAVRRQVVGVRVIRHGERVDVGLEDIFCASLVQTGLLILVALGQGFLDLRRVLACDLQAQDFIFYALAP